MTVSYSLTSDGIVSIDFDGVSDRLTVLNLTNHAYFNLAGKGDILQHRVTIPSSYILETNAEFIPSGGILPVEATEFDFRYGKNIGKDIEKQTQQLEWNRGYNHCYVFSLYDERKMKWTASVYEPKSRRKLDVFTTYPGVLFYSSGYLSSQIVGKQGYKYTPMCGFCLETQYFPDFPNHSEFPQGVVFPEKPYHHTTLYKLSVV